MISFKKGLVVLALGLSAANAMAKPVFLVTHNTTDFESNAWVAGIAPSPYPTPAHSDNKVMWSLVKMACNGHIVNDVCTAVIKMKTNTPNPVDIGTVSMNILSGDINPKSLSGNGFRINVNGPGEVTLSKE